VSNRIGAEDNVHNEAVCAGASNRTLLSAKLNTLVLIMLDYGILNLWGKCVESDTFGPCRMIELSRAAVVICLQFCILKGFFSAMK